VSHSCMATPVCIYNGGVFVVHRAATASDVRDGRQRSRSRFPSAAERRAVVADDRDGRCSQDEQTKEQTATSKNEQEELERRQDDQRHRHAGHSEHDDQRRQTPTSQGRGPKEKQKAPQTVAYTRDQ